MDDAEFDTRVQEMWKRFQDVLARYFIGTPDMPKPYLEPMTSCLNAVATICVSIGASKVAREGLGPESLRRESVESAADMGPDDKMVTQTVMAALEAAFWMGVEHGGGNKPAPPHVGELLN